MRRSLRHSKARAWHTIQLLKSRQPRSTAANPYLKRNEVIAHGQVVKRKGDKLSRFLKSYDEWMERGHAAAKIGLCCFVVSLIAFFVFNMAIFLLLPGMPFWGVLVFTVCTSAVLALMNGFGAWVTLR